MEDAAREAASLTVNNNQLKEVEEEMDKIRKHIDIQGLFRHYIMCTIKGYGCMGRAIVHVHIVQEYLTLYYLLFDYGSGI